MSTSRLALALALVALGCANADRSPPASAGESRATVTTPAGPGQRVARRAALEVRATFRVQVGSVRATAAAVQELSAFAEQRDGWVQSSSLDASGASGQVTLRVPPESLGALRAALARIGGGHGAVHEQVTRTDVTDALADLDARLRVARATETRLLALLDQRGAALADVLAVERSLAEQRTRIEQLESEQRAAQGRVDLATVDVYFAPAVVGLDAPLGAQLGAAARDGLASARAVGVGAVLLALRAGPALLLLGALAALALWAARLWRSMRARA